MNDFILSGCSTADLSKQHFNDRNIQYTCFHYSLDGVNYLDDLGQSMSFEQFYRAMANGAETKTSQINVEEYMQYFRPFLEQGQDVLHVTLSSGLSGSYNSACLARDMLLEIFPDRKLYIVDSLGASSGYGLLLDRLADLRDAGRTIDEVHDWAEAHKLELHHWFFSSDLTFYVKGGRISKASGWFGTVLKICPLLNMDQQGHLVPHYKVRGVNAVTARIVDKMEEFAVDGLEYAEKCFISHSAYLDQARIVAQMVEQRFPHLKGNVVINDIGTTIGSHTGPGTIALFFWGSPRID